MMTVEDQNINNQDCGLESSTQVYRDLLARNGAVISFTRGVSMKPLIYSGRNYVLVKNVQVESLPQPLTEANDAIRIGDVLLFEQMRRGSLVNILHRLVDIRRSPSGDIAENIYITRGDNCLGCEYIRRHDIIGRLESVHFAKNSRKIAIDDEKYLRYVEFWNKIWPVRKQYYRLRAELYKSKLLRSIYHKIKPYIKKNNS